MGLIEDLSKKRAICLVGLLPLAASLGLSRQEVPAAQVSRQHPRWRQMMHHEAFNSHADRGRATGLCLVRRTAAALGHGEAPVTSGGNNKAGYRCRSRFRLGLRDDAPYAAHAATFIFLT